MKIIITILMLIILTGCQSWPSTAIDIANEPYHLIDNNCVHKAKEFIKREPKNNPEIWVVRIPKQSGQHAMVKRDDGWWVDPTSGKRSKPLKGATALYLYEE